MENESKNKVKSTDNNNEKLLVSDVDYQDRYRNIKTEENYISLLKSGMFWEFHPELTGNWYLDEPVINSK